VQSFALQLDKLVECAGDDAVPGVERREVLGVLVPLVGEVLLLVRRVRYPPAGAMRRSARVLPRAMSLRR